MQKPAIGIIGGGASGLIAAIAAAKSGAEVTILEHKDRVGKKILMTGNGKCNITNRNISSEFYYSEHKEYAMSILEQISPEEIITYFQGLGLYTKEKKDGGIYPIAEQAAVVLDCLMNACNELHVKIKTMVSISKITPGKQLNVSGIIMIPDSVKAAPVNKEKKKNKKEKPPMITYHEKPYQQTFDKLILACGSKAASVTGSDGSGYQFAKSLGLSMEPVVPALVQLHCEGDYFKDIAGVRAESELTLYIDGKPESKEYGELQLTDYGVSGIPVFQLSRIVSYAFNHHRLCEITINFLPYPIFQSKEELQKSLHPDQTVIGWLEGFLNKKLCMLFLKRHHMQPEQAVKTYQFQQFDKLIEEIRHFTVTVTKTNPFDSAQVCAGGISLKEIQPDLSLKKYPNIYAVGELLDVDGKCGGYNLQWAWVSGILAGNASSRSIETGGKNKLND